MRRGDGASAAKRSSSGQRFARRQAKAGAQASEATAADRYGIAIASRQFDDAIVAGAPEPDHPVQVDDMAAVDPHEPGAVETPFDVADRQAAEIFRSPIKDVGVMGIGVDGDDVVHGNEMDGTLALSRKMSGACPRRRGRGAVANRGLLALRSI